MSLCCHSTAHAIPNVLYTTIHIIEIQSRTCHFRFQTIFVICEWYWFDVMTGIIEVLRIGLKSFHCLIDVAVVFRLMAGMGLAFHPVLASWVGGDAESFLFLVGQPPL